MPLCSSFNPLGMLALSSKPSQAELIYRSIVASYGGPGKNFTFDKGSRQDATAYAQAMGIARARLTLQRAGNQLDPRLVGEMAGYREQEYGLVPGASDTMQQRRGALASRKLLPLGSNQTNTENALRDLLGAGFVSLRTTPVADAVTWPLALGDSPMNMQRPEAPRKLVRLIAPVATLGAPLAVAYSQITTPLVPGSAPVTLLNGDVVVVDPANNSQAERVTVSAVTPSMFTATFTKSHDAGALATTGSFPWWESTKRHSLVIVTAAVAASSEWRRKIHELMQRLARGVSTWDITDGAGPFKVGVGKLGITPIGAL